MMSTQHEYCWNLLPWFVTGRVSASDSQRIERHLADCPACQMELEQQREVCALVRRDEPVMLAPQASLQKLMARIDATVPESPLDTPEPVQIRATPRVPRWLAIAAAIQAVAIAALLTVVWQQTSSVMNAPRYTTLTTPAPASMSNTIVRIVFKPDMTTGELQTLLRSVDAQLLAGPTEAGVYTLQIHSGTSHPLDMQTTMARLRGDSHVVFAEHVQGETP